MMETDDCCPLCMEDLDVTDRNFRPCKCGYQICLFCYRHIKEDLNGLCPACRTPYDEANITYTTPDPQEMARLAREKKAKELKDKKEQQAKEAKEKRESELKTRQEAQARAAATAASAPAGASSGGAAAASAPVAAGVRPAGSSTITSSAPSCSNGSGTSAEAASRPVAKPQLQTGRQEQLRDMATLRTSQRAIVYVMGLSPRIAKEEILRRHDYFGQYGKIMRIQVSPAGSAATSGPPSLRCCITYATREEAEQAVLAVDNVVLDGRTLKASFGLPKPPPGPLQPGGSADGMQEEKDEAPLKEDIVSRNASSERAAREPANVSISRVSDRGAERNAGWDGGSHAAPPSAATPIAASAAPNAASDPVCTPAVVTVAASTIAVPPPPQEVMPPEAMPVPPPPVEAPSRRAPGPPPPVALSMDMANDCGSAVGMGVVGAAGMGPIGGGVAGMRAMDLARGSSLLSGQPTGSESEPWSMMGSFEDLLNGLVSEEPDEEESALPGSSRFARFFSSSPMEDSIPVAPVGGGSALASLGGIKLDTPFEPSGGKQQDDLQQGFRALLPNVNISFSPFGDRAGPQVNDGLAHGQISAGSTLGSVGGLGGLTAFGSFSAPAVGCLAQPSTIPVGPASGAFSNGSGSGSVSVGAGSFEMPGGLSTGLGSAALNGGSSLPGLGGAPATSDLSLLHQLSGPLPGAQLPGSQLSSQLQSLLQGANGSSSAIGSGRAVGGVVGAGATTDTNGRWPNGRTGEGLSSWLPSEGLLSTKSEDGAPSSEGLLHKEPGAGNSARGGKKEGGGGGDSRGGKGKKRGGTNNRSNKGSEAKPAHGVGSGK
eukprot:CAMPEP_0174728646 /NCGR_PEP_ID=MMETSP1094-20130205/52129_1 /TAXON_ID=156173 /ORGANISM="Chrysochromulina brevifilum, Strain UTEX LB 985" /LENGTH=827 /DNA_ID=CAMNT_0015930611 /DNA_START=112 /DNA_END=2595 /DNA_ORIENTATION=+